MFTKSAYEIYKEEKDGGLIITLCKDLDDAIGGGIRVGSITELVGNPGAGKTQLCLQLCVNVQIPKILNGMGGAAVFIDTNRGFSIDRIKEIAAATQAHCRRVAKNMASNSFTVDSILTNIHCTFCNNYIELLAAVYGLKRLLANTPEVRLIVIDSFSYLFRSIDSDLNLVRMTYEILMELQLMAQKHQCAVVITNELTTRITSDGSTYIVPSLGDSHLHRINHQISMARDTDNKRMVVCNVDKTFTKREDKVPIEITKDGIRPYRQIVHAPVT